MTDHGSPTEQTPLLSKTKSRQLVEQPIDASAAIVPQPADPHDEEENPGQDVEQQTEPQQQNGPQNDPYAETRKSLKYVFAAVAIGVFLAAADQTIIVSSYGKIGSELDALNKTSWIANAYFLTLTAFQPLYGKLSDIFGRRGCLLFAYLVFGSGCLFCGLSKTIDQLIMSRAFAGVGGGGMTTIVSILFSDLIPLRERGTWQGYINIIYASGAAMGAPLGGIIADYLSWRWAFLAQVPLCLVAFVSVWFLLHLPKRDQSHWKVKLRRIDFLGALLLLAAVTILLVGLDRGSNKSWSDRLTIGCLAGSVPLFAVFIAVEIWVAAEPFAPGHIIFERTVFAAYLCNFFSFGGWLAAIFYVPLYYQAVHGFSAAKASLLLIPSIICGVAGSLFGGKYIQWRGRYYWLTFLGYCSLTVGLLLIIASSGVLYTSIAGIVLGMMICAFSNGIGVTTSLIALLANVTDEEQAIATACSYLFRSMGSVTGVAISATAVNQRLRSLLEERLGDGLDADRIADEVRRNLEALKNLTPRIQEIVRESYASSTQLAFGIDVVIVAGAAIAALWIREKQLQR